MKGSIVVLVFLLCCKFNSRAQDAVTVFNNYHENFAIEHIYLQLDKQAYVPGETVWFKAYLYTPGIANRLSTNLYAELLNEKGEIVQSLKLPVLEGKSITNQFEIPGNAPPGVYFIRAWSNYTKYFDASYVFKKAINVFTSSSLGLTATTQAKDKYNFEWFPESGKLINGVDNTIAFRCTDAQMKPAVVSGTLLNQKGEDLGSFSTNQYGLGYFNYSPVQGMKYLAEMQFPDRSTQKIELPVAETEGIALSVADNDNGKDFTLLLSPRATQTPTEVLVLAVMDNEIILNQQMQIKDFVAEGSINADNLRDGVLQFFVFDKNNNLLARRTSFLLNKKRQLMVQLQTTQLNLAPKGLNNWSFILPTGTSGNFSVSITDLEREIVHAADDDLVSSLLMQSGSTQLIRHSKVNDQEVKDLLMLTGGNRNIENWSEYAKRTLPKPGEEMHLPFLGKLYESGNNKIINSGELNFLVKTKDSIGRLFNVPLSNDGSFKLYGLVFEDTARVYYKWKGAKGENAISTDIELEKENINFSPLLKNISAGPYVTLKKQLTEKIDATALAGQIIKDVQDEKMYMARLNAKPLNTERKPIGREADVNKRYTSGAFTSNANAKMINLIDEPPNNISGNIFDYITGRLSGVSIEKKGSSNYVLYTSRSTTSGEVIRNVNTTSVTGPGGVARTPQDFNDLGRVAGKFYLDEVEVTSDVIARITVDQIALVKYFPPGAIMLPGIGLSGVLAVYTKKPGDMGKNESRYFNSLLFPGYPASKQFYSPDYSVEDKKRADARRTIYWNPEISLKEGNEIGISFYNSDKAKKLRVVFEGITADGRLISFEKIVE